YGLVNDFMREWCLRKEQLKSGEISEDEYFEWKINWPATSSKVDYNGKDDKKCSFKWRKR
ncbi:MAG: XRE family transcriptional regulator, partial [Lachnospiraceae bacterium]|nr:XRE family transcriptional regulator [Lachnospiraceae bacterium]